MVFPDIVYLGALQHVTSRLETITPRLKLYSD